MPLPLGLLGAWLGWGVGAGGFGAWAARQPWAKAWGQMPWGKTPEEETDRNTYLERIYQYINAQVQLGTMTRAQGVSVLRYADETVKDWSSMTEEERVVKLPYHKQIMVPEWEWYRETAEIQTALSKGWVAQQQKEARKREYLPQLREYLERSVSMGQITPAQLEQTMASETQGIDLGMPLKDLPTYAGVQSYQSYQETQQELRQQILAGKGTESQRRALEEAGQRMGLQQRIWARGEAGREGIRPEMEAGFGGEEFTGPANWIKRWFAEHRPSRREPSEGLGEEIARIEAQRIVGPGKEFADWGEREARLTELRMAQKGAGGTGVVGAGARGMPEARRKREEPIAPATPTWLAQLTGLEAGEPIRKLPVTTPSAQWFTRQPWSVREGLRGYTEWAGGRAYEDIVEEMYRMLPKEPRGATRWRAPRQWA